MTTLSANSSSTVQLPAGQRLAIAFGGEGRAVVAIGTNPAVNGVPFSFTGPIVIGPYPEARTVFLTSLRTFSYSLQFPPFDGFLSDGSPIVRQDGSGNMVTASGVVAPSYQQSLAYSQIALPKFNAALKLTAAGTRNTRVLCLGDSTTVGLYASGVAYGGSRALNYPNALAAALSARWRTYTSNQLGSGANGGPLSNLVSLDPRWTFTPNWSANSGFILLGGCAIYTATAGEVATFTPTQAWDTVEICFIQSGGAGVFNVSIGGVPVGTVSCVGSNAMKKATFSVSATQLQTLSITSTNGNPIWIDEVSCYDSKNRGIEVLTAGSGGSPSSQMAANTNSWDPSYNVGGNGINLALSPDLTIINLGINDWGAGVTPAVFTANMQTIISAYKATGDVIVMTPNPQSTAVTSAATQLGIVQAARSVAQQNGCLIIDANAAFGDYAFAQGTLGYFLPANDQTHPGAAGYSAMGQLAQAALGI